jgi:hypothetical protein
MGTAPGFAEEFPAAGAWLGCEGNVEVVIGTEVPETSVRAKGTVDVVDVGTEVPCVNARGRPEWASSLCDPGPGRTSAPLDPLDERSTSPKLINAIRMAATART